MGGRHVNRDGRSVIVRLSMPATDGIQRLLLSMGFGLVATLCALTLGASAAGDSRATMLTQALLVVAALSTALTRPSIILTLGSISLPAQLLLPSVSLRPIIIVLLVPAVLASLRRSAVRDRQAATLVLGLGAWVVVIGGLLQGTLVSQLGILLEIAFASLLAALMLLIRRGHIPFLSSVLIMGVIVAWSTRQLDIVALGRSGSIAFSDNANGLGITIAFSIIAGVSVGLYFTGIRRLVIWAISFALLPSLFQTGSRGALLTLGAAVVVVVLSRFRRAALWAFAAGVVIFVSFGRGLFAVVLDAFLAESGRDIQATGGFVVREAALQVALEVGLRHPFGGIGVGNLPLYTAGDPRLNIPISAHNAYAGLLASAGVVPLILLLALTWRSFSYAMRERSYTGLAAIAAVVMAGLSLEWYAHRLAVVALVMLVLPLTRVSAALAPPAPTPPSLSPTSQHQARRAC